MKNSSILKALFVITLTFISILGFSQTSKVDIVYLKDGSVIKGEILEIKIDEYIKIKTLCDNVWVFDNAQIVRIVKKNEKLPKKIDYTKTDFSGGMGDISIGFLIGNNFSDEGPGLNISATYNHEFKNNFSVGGGMGLTKIEKTYLPIFSEIRYTFLETKNSHYIYCKTGYSIVTNDYESYDHYRQNIIKSYGGIFINPGIGVTFKINESNSATVKIAYLYFEDKEDVKDYNNRKIERLNKYNRFEFKIGYTFR